MKTFRPTAVEDNLLFFCALVDVSRLFFVTTARALHTRTRRLRKYACDLHLNFSTVWLTAALTPSRS